MSQDYRYHRQSIRLPGYDYSQPGWYFVTICTYNREHLFGEISNGVIALTDYGKIANLLWQQIPNHYPGVFINEYKIMPNHVHGIIVINQHHTTVGVQNSEPLPHRSPNNHQSHHPSNMFQHIQPRSLGSIVRGFKLGVTKSCRQYTPNIHIWQRNYYEHVIRNESEYFAIKRYIQDNPTDWENDPLHN